MRTTTRPQYHRLRRILEMIREGTRTGSLPNCGHFTRELEVSRRTLMRDLALESPNDPFSVLSEDHVRLNPEVWQAAGRAINQQEGLRVQYQTFDAVI